MAAMPTYAGAVDLGVIAQVNGELTNASGIVASRQNPGVLWAHNDGNSTSTGGTPPEFIALNRSLQVIGRFYMTGVGSGWEDISLGPGPVQGTDYLYFGCQMGGAGGNAGGRIARVPEPQILEGDAYVGTAGSVLAPGAVALDFTLGDGLLHSCECIMVDPNTRAIYIVTKGLQNDQTDTGKVFKFPYPQSASGNTTIPMVADLDISPDPGHVLRVTNDDPAQVPPRSQVTAGDISDDGDWIFIRTRSRDAWLWQRPAGGTVEDAFGSGAPSARQGAGGLNITTREAQEGTCFANFKYDTTTSATDGVPGGIYSIPDGTSNPHLWYNDETAQPTGGANVIRFGTYARNRDPNDAVAADLSEQVVNRPFHAQRIYIQIGNGDGNIYKVSGAEDQCWQSQGPGNIYARGHRIPYRSVGLDQDQLNARPVGSTRAEGFGWRDFANDTALKFNFRQGLPAETPQQYARAQARNLLQLASLRPGFQTYFCFHHEPEDDTGLTLSPAAGGGPGNNNGTPQDYAAAYDNWMTWWRSEGVEEQDVDPNSPLIGFYVCLMAARYKPYPNTAVLDTWMPSKAFRFLGGDFYVRIGDSTSFTNLVGSGHKYAKDRGKRFMIGEIAVAEQFGAGNLPTGFKHDWYIAAGNEMKLSPKWDDAEAICWTDYNAKFAGTGQVQPYEFDSSQQALNGFRTMSHDPRFGVGVSTDQSWSTGDAGKGKEASNLGKSGAVGTSIYDSAATYDDVNIAYDGATTSTDASITSNDGGAGADASSLVTPFTAAPSDETGFGTDSSVLTIGLAQTVNTGDAARGTEPPSLLAKGGNLSIPTGDAGRGIDAAQAPVVYVPPASIAVETCFIANPLDSNYPWSPQAILIDLNAAAGVQTLLDAWELEAEVDLGTITSESSYVVQSPVPGGDFAARRLTVVEATFPLIGRFTSNDSMLANYRALAAAADEGGVIVWKPRGATLPVYLDFDPSDVPALLRGQERALWHIAGLNLVLDLPFKVRRQPLLRSVPVIGTQKALGMSGSGPRDRYVRLSTAGNAGALARIRITPDGSAKTAQVRIGRRSTGDLDDFVANYRFEIDQADLSVDSSTNLRTGQTDASGNKVARTSMAGSGFGLLRRWRMVIPVNSPNSLLGRYRAYAVVKVNGPVQMQLRYGLSNDVGVAPAETTNPQVDLSPPDSTFGTPIEIDLGTVYVAPGTAELVLEGYVGDNRDDPVPSDVDWDQFVLMPADEELATVSIPGFRIGSSERQAWDAGASELGRVSPAGTGNGSNIVQLSDSVKLNDTDEITYAKPAAGLPFPVGQVRVRFQGKLQDADFEHATFPGGRTLARVEVINRSQNDAVVVSKDLHTEKNRLYTPFDVSLKFQADGVSTYRFQFHYLRNDVGAQGKPQGRACYCERVEQSFLYTVDGPSQMVLDGWTHQASVRSSNDERLWSLAADQYIELAEGDNVLVFSFAELPAQTGFDEIDIREPLGKVDVSRNYQVQVDIVPRYMAM